VGTKKMAFSSTSYDAAPKEIKMPRTVFLYALLIILLVAGCGPSSTLEPLISTPESPMSTPELPKSNLPVLDGNWKIKMTHSGGIMGLSRSIEISSDGKYTVIDERANKSVTRELERDELSKLINIVACSEYISMTLPQPSGCADCFVYDLAIHGDGKKFSVQVDDISLPDSGMENLVMYVRDLMDAALK
jgi:hypothetical protein